MSQETTQGSENCGLLTQVTYSEKCTVGGLQGGLLTQVVLKTRLTRYFAKIHAPKLYLTAQKATIQEVTTMLATSKNILFPGHNHLLTAGTDNPSL